MQFYVICIYKNIICIGERGPHWFQTCLKPLQTAGANIVIAKAPTIASKTPCLPCCGHINPWRPGVLGILHVMLNQTICITHLQTC